MTDLESRAAATIDDPLAHWRACHDRLLRMTQLLQRLAAHLTAHPLEAESQVSAASLVNYFENAALMHQADEEEDLFPRLLQSVQRKSAGPVADRIGKAIDALQQQHAELDDLWLQLAGPLHQLAQGTLVPLDSARVNEFVQRYAMHIAMEERDIGPALKRLLTARDLALMATNMTRRRSAG